MSMLDNQKQFRAALARFVATGRQEQEAAKLFGYTSKTTLSALKTGGSRHAPRWPNRVHVLAMERLADMAEAGEL